VYISDYNICFNIVNLASIYIALYFLNNYIKVKKIIKEVFIIKNKKLIKGEKVIFNGFV